MSTVVAKNLAVQNSAGTASTNISFDGTKLVSTALDNSINATANLHDLGVGQTWQDVTASRAAGVTYTNTTQKPTFVKVRVRNNESINNVVTVTISGSSDQSDGGNGSYQVYTSIYFIVQPNQTYSVSITAGTLIQWTELR